MTDTIPDYILKTFKEAFKFYVRDPKSRFVQPIYTRPPHPRDCVHCGGLGRLIVFVASDGPFSDAPTGSYNTNYAEADGTSYKFRMSVVAKWLGDGWYAGKHEAAVCPACHGTRRNQDYVEPPLSERSMPEVDFVKTDSKHIAEEVEYVEDYTNV